jgi:crotonobetainyl-CoA:carnitine CoA-transferase CaiB-like acyl-CoA transferase
MMLPAARELVDGGNGADAGLPTFGDHACYNVYRTKDDRLIALGALEEKFWRGFCDVIGRSDLTARHMSDDADQARLLEEVRAIFLSRTRAEWLAQFGAHEVCLTPVNSPREALADPHVAARGAVIGGPGLRTIRPPFLQASPDLCRAPALGADTDDVLREL